MGAGTRVFTYSGDACHSAKVMLDLAGVICTFNIVPVSMIVIVVKSQAMIVMMPRMNAFCGCCQSLKFETPLDLPIMMACCLVMHRGASGNVHIIITCRKNIVASAANGLRTINTHFIVL